MMRFASRLPWGVLGALVLILTIESRLHRLEPVHFSTVWVDDWRRTAQAASTTARDAELLCFGDSAAKFGLVPSELEDATGLRTHSLAMNVGHALAAEILLDRALAAGARPRVVVLEAVPHLLAASPRCAVRLWPALLRLEQWHVPAIRSRDPRFVAELLVGRIFASVRARFEIRESIIAALGSRLPDSAYLLPILRRQWTANRGAQLMSKRTTPLDPGAFRAELLPSAWSPDPVQAEALRRSIGRARSVGARVVLLLPPFIPSVHERRRAAGLETSYERFIDRLTQEFPGLEVFDARDSCSDDDLHVDPIHLDVGGAIALSRALGEWVAEPPTGAFDARGWGLPSGLRRGASPGEVEDLERSRIAIRDARGADR
ncbi:MAG: hypothetical protein SFX72_11955 [Isosphaeraceae bacterium]|nr:hypothetical protein [Isosphaeraceae bacterium]